jgi:hypothetical protein
VATTTRDLFTTPRLIKFCIPHLNIMDEALATFSAITGATPHVANHFLSMTDGDAQQAIQLFFDSPDLGSSIATEPPSEPPAQPSASTQRHASTGRTDSKGVIHLDSDDDDAMDESADGDFINEDSRGAASVVAGHTAQATPSTHQAAFGDYEDDEAMARRMQEELYAGGDMSGGFGGDNIRAPLARTTETLVGPGAEWTPDDMHDAVLEQMRARAQPRSKHGRYNCIPT